MTRKEQIVQQALRIHNDDDIERFVAGAEWADQNPAMVVTNTGWPYEKQLHDKISKLERELEIAYTYIEVLEGNKK